MVIFLTLLIAILSFTDLGLTLRNIQSGGFKEANPLMLMIMRYGGVESMILAKFLVTGFFVTTCIKARKTSVAEVGSLFVFLSYLLLLFHWTVAF